MTGEPKLLMQKVGNKILLRRWVVMVCLGVISILFDVYVFTHLPDFKLGLVNILQVLFDGILVPSLGVILFGVTEYAVSERNRMIKYFSFREILNQQVDNSPHWDDLVKTIVEYPRNFIQITGSVLEILDLPLDRVETRAVWGFYGEHLPPRLNPNQLEACRLCAGQRDLTNSSECSCDILPDVSWSRYCLPLSYGSRQVALLFLYLPPKTLLSKNEQQTLMRLAPDMARALADARRKRMNLELKEAAESQRKQIARSLHDNLAHRLILVRNKLDQFTASDSLATSVNLHDDLTKLRDMVEEAYVGVREILKEIEANSSVDLEVPLKDYLESFELQAGINANFISRGNPQSMPTSVALQIMYILGEVFSNIEKHARASQVEVNLEWSEYQLVIKIADDGCGFMPHANHQDGHMGLSIMQQRAQDIQADLTVKSRPRAGTVVTMLLPINPEL